MDLSNSLSVIYWIYNLMCTHLAWSTFFAFELDFCILNYVNSYQIIFYHDTSYRVILYHITLYHLILYNQCKMSLKKTIFIILSAILLYFSIVINFYIIGGIYFSIISSNISSIIFCIIFKINFYIIYNISFNIISSIITNIRIYDNEFNYL